MLKKILCLALAAVLCCTPVLAAPAPTHNVNAKAAILYEVNTDTVLMEQDADMKLFPASTTKLMTALIALEYGNPDDVVTVTNEAIDGLYELGSASYLLNGEEIADTASGADARPKAAAVSTDTFGPDSEMTYGYCTELLLQLTHSCFLRVSADNAAKRPVRHL